MSRSLRGSRRRRLVGPAGLDTQVADAMREHGDLVASDEEKYAMMIGLSEGSLSEADFATWLRAHLVVTRKGKLQEQRAAYRR